jgi:hypothetical protein
LLDNVHSLRCKIPYIYLRKSSQNYATGSTTSTLSHLAAEGPARTNLMKAIQ